MTTKLTIFSETTSDEETTSRGETSPALSTEWVNPSSTFHPDSTDESTYVSSAESSSSILPKSTSITSEGTESRTTHSDLFSASSTENMTMQSTAHTNEPSISTLENRDPTSNMPGLDTTTITGTSTNSLDTESSTQELLPSNQTGINYNITEGTPNATSIPYDFRLSWYTWTAWSDCYFSSETNQYERIRLRLCTSNSSEESCMYELHRSISSLLRVCE